jgi:hypothetical protein
LIPKSPFFFRLCRFVPISVGCASSTFTAQPAISALS